MKLTLIEASRGNSPSHYYGQVDIQHHHLLLVYRPVSLVVIQSGKHNKHPALLYTRLGLAGAGSDGDFLMVDSDTSKVDTGLGSSTVIHCTL